MAIKRTSDDGTGSASAAAASRRTPLRRAKHSPAQKQAPENRVGVAPATAEPSPVPAPSREEIARLAYAYWEDRGQRGGSPEEDWRRAEQRLAAGVSRASA